MQITVEDVQVGPLHSPQFESCGGENCGNCEPSCESCGETVVPSGGASARPVTSLAEVVGASELLR